MIWRLVTLLLLAVLFGRTAAQAQGTTVDGGTASSQESRPVCVDAEIDGARTLSYDCLSRQLAPKTLAGNPGAASSAAEALATGPSNRVGTFNESAESIRFGSSWGKSVFPQRPPPLQMMSPGH